MDLVPQIIAELDAALTPIGFTRRPAVGAVACWAWRTLNHNRAVVLIECPPNQDPALFARDHKNYCRGIAGFIVPIFYEMGLQIITLGPPVVTDPTAVVDKFSNQICVLQSVHIVDLERNVVTSAATWGQTVTKQTQEAIAYALRSALREAKKDAHDHGETSDNRKSHGQQPLIKTAEQPKWHRTWMTIAAWGALLAFIIAAILRLIFVTMR
jgi:hypothetical protein